MKFKKEIATLLLVSALLTTSLTACQKTPDGGNKINNTTPEITTIETTPQTPPEATTPEPPTTDEVAFEEPVVGENITCSLFSPSESIKGFEMRAGTGVYDFYPANDSKNRYFYIEQWDQALKFTDGTNATFVEDVLVTDDYLYVLAEFNASFLIDSNRWIKVITMKIDRNGTIVESHINKFEWNTHVSSTERIDYNLYSPEQFYIFYTDKGEADTPNGQWQIQVYESTDMGKTWSPKGEPYGGTSGKLQTWDFLLTRDFGYFVYTGEDITHQYDVYTTTDGGGTWQLQPFSCIDPNEEYYVKFNGIIVVNDEYVASFKAEKRLEGKGDEEEKVTFICKSNDFTEWTLTATRPQSSPSPYEEELDGNYYVCENFINDQLGYTFVFDCDTEFLTFLKTTDGGKTWERQPIVDAPEPGMHLGIDDAKMFTEDTGFIKKLWHGDGVIYVTTDGGKTWTHPDYGAPSAEEEFGYDDEASIEYVDGKYLLTVRTRGRREISFTYITQYESTDLRSWELVQPRTVIPCNGGIYNSGVHYMISEDGDLILYIPKWKEFFIVPNREDMYLVAETVEASCAVLSENKCTIFFRDFAPNNKPISLIQFTKGNPEVTIQPLNLPDDDCGYGQKYCNFIDDKIGYIFITEEVDHPGFASGAQKISKLYKTQDGGKSWDSLNCDNIPYISLRYSLMLAKFVTEDIGIIAGHLGPHDFNFHERTYITKDGGLSWIPVDLSAFADLFAYQVLDIEAYDLQYTNGTYYLYVEDRGEPTPEGVCKPCYIFTSTDGVEWNYLEKVN